MTVSCLLLVTITIRTTMVIIVVVVVVAAVAATTKNTYDQWLVNKSPTSQQTRNCDVNSSSDQHDDPSDIAAAIRTTDSFSFVGCLLNNSWS